jgi:hypothetical protein
LPAAQQQPQLEALLIVDPVTQQLPLDSLKTAPTRYSAPALVEALNQPNFQKAPLSLVTKGWSRWVNLPAGEIHRRAYTFYVLEQLMDGLKKREIFVSPAFAGVIPKPNYCKGKPGKLHGVKSVALSLSMLMQR